MSKAKSFLEDFGHFFFLSCILFIPVGFHLFPGQEAVTAFFFQKSIAWTASHIFQRPLKNSGISSDALSMYLLVFLLLVLSLVISTAAMYSSRWQQVKGQTYTIIKRILIYYLSLQLFIYGFDKIFKAQFYQPEPNTLYTAFGDMSRDLLYWSTVGTSYPYNIFLGAVEVIAALLLVMKRTRVLGLLVSSGIMCHVVAVNFSFDISVKLYSCLLLSLSLFLLWPQMNRLYRFLLLQQNVSLKTEPSLPQFFRKNFVRATIKTFMICFFFFEAAWPRLAAGKFNDDNTPRPHLHGAYGVEAVFVNDKPIAASSFAIKRIFIHRHGYLIFQNDEGKMQDFKFEADASQQKFIVTKAANTASTFAYKYDEDKRILELRYCINGKEYTLHAKALNWKELPALQPTFHWTVDNL